MYENMPVESFSFSRKNFCNFLFHSLSPLNSHHSEPIDAMGKLSDEGISKLYFTISEVGAMVEEEAHVLRYWETEFRQLRPKKNKAGKRIYTRADIDTVFNIRHLLRSDKYTLEGARQAMAAKTRRSDTNTEENGDLSQVREFLTQVLERIGT